MEFKNINLEECMERYNVTGLSMVVIEDGQFH